MKGFVGVADNDWFAFLSQQQGIDEVNFWEARCELEAGLDLGQVLITSSSVFLNDF